MLDENISSPGMDLWALGCIIYEMRVGQTPFHGTVDYEVFNKIKDRQLVIPNELEPEVVDIIDKLLQLDPRHRLGAGPSGSELDFEALKSHPFFASINFDSLNQTSPPIPADRFMRYFEDQKARDLRQSQEQLFFNNQGIAQKVVANDSPTAANQPNEAASAESSGVSVASSATAEMGIDGLNRSTDSARGLNRLSSRLLGKVQTVYEGVVMKYPKRKKAFAKPRCRNMILTNQPRLYFTSTEQVDGKEGMYLSDIILYKQLKVSMNRGKDTLIIQCPISQFTYQLKTNDAELWHKNIQQAILEKEFDDSSMI